MATISVHGKFDDLIALDGLFIINDHPTDSVGSGGGEVMPGPPVVWNSSSPVRDYDWSFFTVAVDGAAQVRYSGRGATLVSPSYAVCAHHARGPGTGFYWVPNAGGAEVKRTSSMTQGVDYWNIDGDLGLIKLNSPVTTVTPIPILVDSSLAGGKSCVAIELDRHLNQMTVASTLDNSDTSATINRTGTPDGIEGGDSGKPAVCMINGSPVLVITAILTGDSSYASGPNASHYIDDIQAILDADAEELTLLSLVRASNDVPSYSPLIPSAFSPTTTHLAMTAGW